MILSPFFVAARVTAGTPPDYARRAVTDRVPLFGLQESSDRLHIFGLEIPDDAVHDRRLAQARLNDRELSQNVLGMLPRQPRKNAVTFGILAVACGTCRNVAIGYALLEELLAVSDQCRIARNTAGRFLPRKESA
jgi:hypothetical protein